MKRKHITVARILRRNQTNQEARLWSVLRDRNIYGLKFRRQYSIGDYVVDFYCPKSHLVIELDGGGHNEEEQMQSDTARDTFLKNKGYKVLRVWNYEISDNLEGVVEKIIELSAPSPQPSPRRGEGGKAV